MPDQTATAEHPANVAHRLPRPRMATWQRLLDQLGRLADGRAELIAHSERAWASATFTGARHHFTLGFSGADEVVRGEHLIAALPDHEFALPGQLVADAAVIEVDHTLAPAPHLTVTCELLLVEDR